MTKLLRFTPVVPLVWVLGQVISSGQTAPAKPPSDTAFQKEVRPFLTNTCFGCHNAKVRSAGIDLQAFTTAESIAKDAGTWELAVRKMRSGEMPPPPLPRPKAEDLATVTDWIEQEFERADRLAGPNPGRVTARRLNRAEYNNTIRDLLGVDFRPADDFPQDDSGYGFDTIGDVLSLPPVLLEKYLTAAETAVRTALFGPAAIKPTMIRYQPHLRRPPPPPSLTDYDFTGLSLPSALSTKHRFPADAEYVFKIQLNGQRPGGSEPLKVAAWIDAEQVKTFEVDGADLEGMTVEFKSKVTAGDHLVSVSFLKQFHGLPTRFGGPEPSKRPEPARRFPGGGGAPPAAAGAKPPADPAKPPVEAAKLPIEPAKPAVAPAKPAGGNRQVSLAGRVNALDIGGPFEPVLAPSQVSRKKILVCGHLEPGAHVEGCDRKILSAMARRAYRRAITRAEVDELVAIAAKARQRGENYEESVAVALQGILISPHFLFRIERASAPTSTANNALIPISNFELASRLSYFLWSSTPDDELLHVAERGTLKQPAVLRAQLRRMLADDKARALVENFGGQWLQIRALESVKPDWEKFEQFDDYLRESMRRETELFLQDLIRNDRSVTDLLDAKYTYLNERLARFYDIKGVEGQGFRKVDLTGTPRGGLLTHASVLTVSSYATRTSPVLRGKWILENILNAPPPPAPPDVPALEDATVGTTATLREQMEKHRSNAVCASCHSRMDPLGFALENFDAIGAWRDKDGKFPIDSSGKLPDGRSFKNLDELKVILRADKEELATAVTEKLMIFGLGRGMERYDRRTIKEIVKRSSSTDYKFSSILYEIVRSMPFQMRKGEKSRT
ncbi:MAG TPA: DUF1592 domain-containing protein [Bryobacteraceae bacterium]|nr:DUF1592 domain-containing protein [Bryobacteraceae bacterium]